MVFFIDSLHEALSKEVNITISGEVVNEIDKKALEAMKSSNYPTCYFDVVDMIAKLDGGFLPYTPPVNLLRGMRVALDMIFEEGLENVLLTGGGIISKADMKELANMGVGKLFGPGTPVDTTIEYIENWVNDNRN